MSRDFFSKNAFTKNICGKILAWHHLNHRLAVICGCLKMLHVEYLWISSMSANPSGETRTLPRSSSMAAGLEKNGRARVQAIFSHAAGDNGTLLSFSEGDVITLLVPEARDGWHYGENEKNKMYVMYSVLPESLLWHWINIVIWCSKKKKYSQGLYFSQARLVPFLIHTCAAREWQWEAQSEVRCFEKKESVWAYWPRLSSPLRTFLLLPLQPAPWEK